MSFQVTSIVVPLTTTPPLLTSGTLVVSSGTYLRSYEVSSRPSIAGVWASMSVLACA